MDKLSCERLYATHTIALQSTHVIMTLNLCSNEGAENRHKVSTKFAHNTFSGGASGRLPDYAKEHLQQTGETIFVHRAKPITQAVMEAQSRKLFYKFR